MILIRSGESRVVSAWYDVHALMWFFIVALPNHANLEFVSCVLEQKQFLTMRFDAAHTSCLSHTCWRTCSSIKSNNGCSNLHTKWSILLLRINVPFGFLPVLRYEFISFEAPEWNQRHDYFVLPVHALSFYEISPPAIRLWMNLTFPDFQLVTNVASMTPFSKSFVACYDCCLYRCCLMWKRIPMCWETFLFFGFQLKNLLRCQFINSLCLRQTDKR